MIVCPYFPDELFRDIMEVCLCARCSDCILKRDIFSGVDPVDAFYESEDNEI